LGMQVEEVSELAPMRSNLRADQAMIEELA
jgi:hypothetical protein